jgi:nitrogen regulatory protein P-II 1
MRGLRDDGCRPFKKDHTVKKIEAIIRHFKLEDVKAALLAQGVHGMSISEVRGFGRQKGQREMYRGVEYTVDFLPKVKIDVMVADEQLDAVLETLVDASRTAKVGDGKIFVTDLPEVHKIRTGESGVEAL